MTRPQPPCPQCTRPTDRIRRTPGAVAVQPCGCWITPDQADQVAADYARLKTLQGQP